MDAVKTYSYEIASVIITIAILVYFKKTKKASNFQNGVFFTMLLDNMLTVFFEVMGDLAYWFALPTICNEISSLGYYITHILVVPLFFFYILSIAKDWYEQPLILKWVSLMPIVAGIAVLLTNPFTHLIFYYDEFGVYHRKDALIGLYGIIVFYIILMILILILYGKKYSFFKRMLVLLSIGIMCGSVAIQYFNYYIRMETFGVAYSCLLLFFFIQNPRHQVDKDSQLYNENVFAEMFAKNIASKKYFDLLVVGISDYSVLTRNIFDYKKNNIPRQLGDFFQSLDDDFVVYRNTLNVYSIEMKSIDEESVNDTIKAILERFKKPWQYGEQEILYNVRVCHVPVPEEVNSINKIQGIISEINIIPSSEGIVDIGCFNLEAIEREILVSNIFSDSFNKNNLELLFKPVFDSKTGELVATETSSRYFDKQIGMVYEEEYLKGAEKKGKIYDLHISLFEKMCDFVNMHDLDKMGIMFVGIKLSSSVCTQHKFLERIQEILKEKKVDSSKICFQISEYTISCIPEVLNNVMKKLYESGCRFCLDDYGSGYTNLTSIYDLPINYIKLDESVSTSAIDNDKAKVTLESSLELAKDLDMSTVMDGISSKSIFEMIKEMPCDYAAGPYLSKLMTEREFVELVMGGKKNA